MKAKRIYRDRFYVVARTPGISGFKRWGELEYGVVTGAKAARHRTEVVGELLPIAEDYYRLANGHLPEFQPLARLPEALEWLRQNQFQEITRLDPATRSKPVAPHYA